MAERLSRKELYDLIWSEPTKTLAARFGISDVALKKTCERAAIPTPDRGYWAKRDAGKETFKPALPARQPGMDDEVTVAAGRSYWGHSWTEDEHLRDTPKTPEFPEPLASVREIIAKAIGHVSVPSKVTNWHPAINRLLVEDEKRRQEQLHDPYPYSWNAPLFDSPLERRRLRILNALFFATAKLKGKPAITGREGRQIGISFHQQHICIKLDKVERARKETGSTSKKSEDHLCLSIVRGYGSDSAIKSWQDDNDGKLEAKLTDAAIEIVLAAEVQYREGVIREYEWRVKRKAELEQEVIRRRIEAERAEKERLRKLEQARVDRLLQDAAAFRRAEDIRNYVRLIRTAAEPSINSTEELERWSSWALAVADRIDPAVGGKFLSAMQDHTGR
jgi:hypothetical protein